MYTQSPIKLIGLSNVFLSFLRYFVAKQDMSKIARFCGTYFLEFFVGVFFLRLSHTIPLCEVVLLTAIEYNSGGEQGTNGEKTKTINHHGEMRVVNLEDESKAEKEGAANEKPVSAWRPLQKDGNSLGVLSLKSVRKYQLQSEHSYCHKCI